MTLNTKGSSLWGLDIEKHVVNCSGGLIFSAKNRLFEVSDYPELLVSRSRVVLEGLELPKGSVNSEVAFCRC